MPRKAPFSGKAKKQQLQSKRQRKSVFDEPGRRVHLNLLKNPNDDDVEEEGEEGKSMVQKINEQPKIRGGRGKPNRYALQFYRESEKELQDRKELARKELKPVPKTSLEINLDDYFEPALDFPKRPPWNFEMSRDELEAREQRYFTEYVMELEKKFDMKTLSYFELNIETWRQLWRVLEISDIILVIVDIRYAEEDSQLAYLGKSPDELVQFIWTLSQALMFPPSLNHFVTETLKKDMILILNKIDLAPAPLVVAWTHYFLNKYPGLQVLQFTSFPGYNLRGKTEDKSGANIRRRKGRLRMAAEGAQKLFQACKNITKDEVDLVSWQNKISEEMNLEYECDDEEVEIGAKINLKKVDTDYVQNEKFKGGMLTIGCVGQPNVGKSSLMNAIMGKKVVSVSRTPGHTKHFQTIHLTSNVRLCDCPGLVFPSKVPKTLQVLMGSYPIAQLREPFSSVQFLAERVDLIKLLRISHPEDDDSWSAMDICDGWALKRGFRTAKAARLDSYRAANNILRMALDGKIALCLRPPDFTSRTEFWAHHDDISNILWIQARNSDASGDAPCSVKEYSSDEEFSSENEPESLSSGGSKKDCSDKEGSSKMCGMGNKFNVLASPD